jgi:DNA polymerase (family X)
MRPNSKSQARSINSSIARRLDEVAQILEEQGANVFRVGAYKRAAEMLRELNRPVDEILRTEGLEGLQRLPGIGETLARFIH